MSDVDLASVIMSVILGVIVSVIMVVIADVIVNDDDDGSGDGDVNDRWAFIRKRRAADAVFTSWLPCASTSSSCALPCTKRTNICANTGTRTNPGVQRLEA